MSSRDDRRQRVWFTEYGIPIRNLWHMLLYAWNEPFTRIPISPAEIESAPSLDALFAKLLIHLMQQRMRIGLGHAYVDAAGPLRAVRGRIDFAESLKRRAFDHGEAYCEFQQYSANEPRNQIIRSTLARLAQGGELGPRQKEAEALRQRLRWLVRNLDGIDLIELTPERVSRQELAQNEHDYRLMLAICGLILQRQMPLDSQGATSQPAVDRDALVLHRIYERFVANFYRIHLKGWKVVAQQRLDWHAQQASDHLPSMVPDLLLQEKSTGRMIVLDTKFTAGSLVDNRWGKPVYDSSHLYQLYAYLRSQEHLSQAHRTATGILLYPSAHGRLSESVQLQDHSLRIECLDLTEAWQEIERRLLKLIR